MAKAQTWGEIRVGEKDDFTLSFRRHLRGVEDLIVSASWVFVTAGMFTVSGTEWSGPTTTTWIEVLNTTPPGDYLVDVTADFASGRRLKERRTVKVVDLAPVQ